MFVIIVGIKQEPPQTLTYLRFQNDVLVHFLQSFLQNWHINIQKISSFPKLLAL